MGKLYVTPRYVMGIVPRNNNTGGVEEPSLRISGSVAGRRCVPRGEERRVSASRRTRCGSRYTPDRRWMKDPSDSEDIVIFVACVINQLLASPHEFRK